VRQAKDADDVCAGRAGRHAVPPCGAGQGRRRRLGNEPRELALDELGVDAKVAFDDNAEGRHKEWNDLRDVDEEEAEAEPFLFAEALERLDEIEGLSQEGRRRLEEFRDELRELRVEARKPVPEFLGEPKS